jgi:hypothetical protein
MMRKWSVVLFVVALLVGWAGISQAQECPLVAAKDAKEFHKAECSLAQKIKATDKMCFNYPEEAVQAGKVACDKCQPPQHTKVVASKKTDKYHIPSCIVVKYIKPENHLEFTSPEDAVKAGYPLPCVVCKPPKAAENTGKK